jgi:hypothetical protein
MLRETSVFLPQKLARSGGRQWEGQSQTTCKGEEWARKTRFLPVFFTPPPPSYHCPTVLGVWEKAEEGGILEHI